MKSRRHRKNATRSGKHDPLTDARGQEFRWIDWLRRLEGTSSPRSEVIGIGDDAGAWKPAAGANVVLTVDAQVEGVHFRRSWLTYREIGRFVEKRSTISGEPSA